MMKNTVLMVTALAALAGGCKKKDENKGTGEASGSAPAMTGSDKGSAPVAAGSDKGSAPTAGSDKGSATPPVVAADALLKQFETCWGYFNDGKFDDFKGCYTADAVSEMPGFGAPPDNGNQAIADGAKMFKTAFPDIKGEFQFEMLSGHTIISVVLTTGTNTVGMKMPGMPELPATGKKFGNYFSQVLDLDDAGKVKHESAFFDFLTTLGQVNPQKGMSPARAVAEKIMGEKIVVVTKDDDKEKANLAASAKFWDAFNKHDVKAVGETVDDKLVWSEAANAKDENKKEFLASIGGLWKSFSDVKLTVSKSWAAGDYVAHVASFDGTNDGDGMMGKKTGKKVTAPFLQVEKIEGGKVTMAWVLYQNLGFMAQLGMLPPPPAAAGSGSASPAKK